MEVVEMRCPVGPRRLLGKVLREGGRLHVTDSNLMELNCDDCKKTMRQRGDYVTRVLHRYDLAGELVESVIERPSTSGRIGR